MMVMMMTSHSEEESSCGPNLALSYHVLRSISRPTYLGISSEKRSKARRFRVDRVRIKLKWGLALTATSQLAGDLGLRTDKG